MLPRKIATVKDLGRAIRARRLALGWTIEAAAGWCNVSTTFLFECENGKSTIQASKLLEVAARFGLGLAMVGGAVASLPSPGSETSERVVRVWQGHPDPDNFVVSRMLAYRVGQECGLELPPARFDLAERAIYLTRCAAVTPLFKFEKGMPWMEKHGGPGWVQIFETIDERSSDPLPDIHAAVRFGLFSYLIADTNHSAVQFIARPAGQDKVRLAPFGLPSLAPAILAKEADIGGMRIGTSWPSDFLRIDAWLGFAASARVRPRVVLTMLAELAEKVPDAVARACQAHYKTVVPRGAVAQMYKVIQTRAARSRELYLAAGAQGVAGIPRPAPVPRDQVLGDPEYMGHETVYE